VRVLNADGNETIHVRGGNGNIILGGNGQDGDVSVLNEDGNETIHLSGDTGKIILGGNGQSGDVSVLNKDGNETIRLSGDTGNIVLGCKGHDGDVSVLNKDGNETIYLSGDTGDIILRNADCAEDFDVADSTDIGPGTVVAIDENGELRESREAYERTVAGVISGAGEYRPGIRLGKCETGKTRLPVALVGKVYCKADAVFGAIRFGDLLTTSPTYGHAMKASDPARAFGAVIGKALQPLEFGQGLIPILVALQ
jgi:hypothetical protein